MVFLKQHDVIHEKLQMIRGMLQTLFPLVKAAAINIHDSAQFFNRKLSGQLHYDLEFLLFKEMYSLPAPSPFTSYPFFARASLTLARMSSSISSSLDIAL